MDYREPWYDDDPDRQYVASDVQKLHYSSEESAHTSTTNMKEMDNYVDKVAKAFHKYKSEMWWEAYKEKLKGTYHKGKYDTLMNRDSGSRVDGREIYTDHDRKVADADNGDVQPSGVI